MTLSPRIDVSLRDMGFTGDPGSAVLEGLRSTSGPGQGGSFRGERVLGHLQRVESSAKVIAENLGVPVGIVVVHGVGLPMYLSRSTGPLRVSGPPRSVAERDAGVADPLEGNSDPGCD